MNEPSSLSFEEYLDWLVANQEFFQNQNKKVLPKPPLSPGQYLKQHYLVPNKITQTKLAKMLGCTHAKVNEVIHGKRTITPQFALDLERVLGDPAEHWLSLQANYLLWQARQTLKES